MLGQKFLQSTIIKIQRWYFDITGTSFCRWYMYLYGQWKGPSNGRSNFHRGMQLLWSQNLSSKNLNNTPKTKGKSLTHCNSQRGYLAADSFCLISHQKIDFAAQVQLAVEFFVSTRLAFCGVLFWLAKLKPLCHSNDTNWMLTWGERRQKDKKLPTAP